MSKNPHPIARVLFSVWLWMKKGADMKSFLLDENIPSHRILYLSSYTSTAVVRLYEEEIEKISKNPLCLQITFYRETRPRKESEIILEQIGVSFEAVTASPNARFGMISAEREIFYSLSPQLENAKIEVLPYSVPPIPALHPSVVLSQIIGKEISVSGNLYRGVVPDSTALFSTSETDLDVLFAVERFIERGIKIINFSAGVENTEEYSDFDRQLDRIIEATDILFVTAAGNRRFVASPGIAFNVLSVGNLETKSAPDTYIPCPWNTRCVDSINCSAFISSPAYAHKPDISAPGTYIPYVAPNMRIITLPNVGTSYACPWVTGVAIHLQDAYPEISALELKGILTLSAQRSCISDLFNQEVENEPFLRVRTGAGALNSERALACARDSQREILISSGNDQKEILMKTSTLSVSLVYYKSTEREEDLYLSLEDEEGEIITANRANQNLHILEYYAFPEKRLLLKITGTPGIRYALIIWHS